MRIVADEARIAAVEIAAQAARLHGPRRLGECKGKRQHARVRLLQHLQRRTPHAVRPHAGQFRQQTNQFFDFRAAHGAFGVIAGPLFCDIRVMARPEKAPPLPLRAGVRGGDPGLKWGW